MAPSWPGAFSRNMSRSRASPTTCWTTPCSRRTRWSSCWRAASRRRRRPSFFACPAVRPARRSVSQRWPRATCVQPSWRSTEPRSHSMRSCRTSPTSTRCCAGATRGCSRRRRRRPSGWRTPATTAGAHWRGWSSGHSSSTSAATTTPSSTFSGRSGAPTMPAGTRLPRAPGRCSPSRQATQASLRLRNSGRPWSTSTRSCRPRR